MHAINASLVNIWEREPLNMHFRILKRLVSTVVRGEYHERKNASLVNNIQESTYKKHLKMNRMSM